MRPPDKPREFRRSFSPVTVLIVVCLGLALTAGCVALSLH